MVFSAWEWKLLCLRIRTPGPVMGGSRWGQLAWGMVAPPRGGQRELLCPVPRAGGRISEGGSSSGVILPPPDSHGVQGRESFNEEVMTTKFSWLSPYWQGSYLKFPLMRTALPHLEQILRSGFKSYEDWYIWQQGVWPVPLFKDRLSAKHFIINTSKHMAKFK